MQDMVTTPNCEIEEGEGDVLLTYADPSDFADLFLEIETGTQAPPLSDLEQTIINVALEDEKYKEQLPKDAVEEHLPKDDDKELPKTAEISEKDDKELSKTAKISHEEKKESSKTTEIQTDEKYSKIDVENPQKANQTQKKHTSRKDTIKYENELTTQNFKKRRQEDELTTQNFKKRRQTKDFNYINKYKRPNNDQLALPPVKRRQMKEMQAVPRDCIARVNVPIFLCCCPEFSSRGYRLEQVVLHIYKGKTQKIFY